LSTQDSLGDRELEIEPDEERMLREGALRREGEKPWPDFDGLQARELERLDEGPLGQGEVVVEEVRVCSTRVADVWLKNEQPASRPQHSPDRGKCPQEVLLCKEILEEVTRKHDVDQFARQGTEVGTDALDDLDAGASVGPNFLTRVQGNSTTADDVVNELTIASANIEDDVTGVEIILEEVPTEDLPDAVLSRFVFRTESRRVKTRQLHIAHGVRVTLFCDGGKASSVAGVRRHRKWDCEERCGKLQVAQAFAPDRAVRARRGQVLESLNVPSE